MDVTRIVQLMFRILMALLVGKAGMDAATATSIAQPFAEMAGAGLLALMDLVMHSARWGKLNAWMETLPEATAAAPDVTAAVPDAPEAPTPKNGMPMLLVMAGLSAFIVQASALSGCAANETNRVAQSLVATTENARIAQNLHDAGVTTPAQEHAILQLLKAEAKAEDAYYAAIQAGDSTAMKAAKAALAAAVSAAHDELAKYHLPATQPATMPGK